MQRRRWLICTLLACLLLASLLVGPVTAQKTLNDQWMGSWQNCSGSPCLNVKNATSSGPWTGPGTLNDLLFSAFGTCSGVPCLTVNASGASSATMANPTGTVGLTTVNGVLTTAMRSDAAPPLSQAIVPTWTGQHTFSLSQLQTAIAAPASPAAGFLATYEDSTDLRFHDKNAAGTIATTVVADTGAANNFLTAISPAGVVSKSQPSCSSLSNSAGGCSMSTTAGGDLSGTLPSPTVVSTHITGGTNTDLATFNATGNLVNYGGSTCTNQAVTALSAAGAATCTTLTSAYTSGTFPATAHNILSATHGDTTPASAVRGDVITAQGASPTWSRLAKGTQYQTLQGGATEPLWDAVHLDQATAITGNLPLGNGGTNAALTASNGGIFYSSASAGAILAGNATANKMLLSGASTTPSWSTSTIPTSAGATANKVLLSDGTNYVLSTPTFPNASATSGKTIRSDGTNWIASTATLSDAPSTAGKVLISDGTNWITSTPTFPNASATSGKYIKSDGTNWIASTGSASGAGSCTNQAVTALTSDAAPTCTTLTSAYVDSSIATLAAANVFTANQSVSQTVAGITLLQNTNLSTGTTAQTLIRASNSTTSVTLGYTSTGYTSAVTYDRQAGAYLESGGAGGLSLGATAAGGIITFNTGGNTERAQFNSSGNFFLEALNVAATGDYLCNNTGTNEVTKSTAVCTLSARRYKTDIAPVGDDALTEVLALTPVRYRYKPEVLGTNRDRNHTNLHVGLIAEEVHAVDPLLVTIELSGPYQGQPQAVRYEDITSLSVGAIQGLHRDMLQMQRRITALEQAQSQ